MEKNAEQEKAEEETDFELSQVKEDEIDTGPYKDEVMDECDEIDYEDDWDENEINADENLDEENHTDSYEEDSQMEKEFEVKLEDEEKPQETLPCNFCSFVSSAKKGHNRNTALKRHMRIFHPETLAETVRP